MVISPYRTSVTAAHQDFNKRVEPDMTKRFGKRYLKNETTDEDR